MFPPYAIFVLSFARIMACVNPGRAVPAMSKPAKTDTPASFESALAELEKIVASMESGKLTLEQSLAAHKRGLELAQYCQSVLARAQQQVKVLEENALKNFSGADDDQ
jgi:exodeoxyribonuclease VII small subunit